MAETETSVSKILQTINDDNSTLGQKQPIIHKQKNPNANAEEANIRGKPKSGRFWKTNKERFSTVNKNKGLKQPFTKKAALRTELKRIKELSQQLKASKAEREELRKQRRRENIKRSEENKRKSEVVQVITNTAKIKRMRKKQLRFIQKRDTTDAANSSK